MTTIERGTKVRYNGRPAVFMGINNAKGTLILHMTDTNRTTNVPADTKLDLR
jgi:hypothetical protein